MVARALCLVAMALLECCSGILTSKPTSEVRCDVKCISSVIDIELLYYCRNTNTFFEPLADASAVSSVSV